FDPDAAVPHRDDDAVADHALRHELEVGTAVDGAGPQPRLPRVERVAGIGQQVDQHAVQALAVGDDGRQPGIEGEEDLARMRAGHGAGGRGLAHAVDVDGAEVELDGPREVEHPLHQAVEPDDLPVDVAQRLSPLRLRDLVVPQGANGRLDDHEGIPDLVCD